MDLNIIDRHLRLSLRLLASVASISIAAYFIWFGLILGEPLSTDAGTWGEFGDFVGGLLNPLVAACALYWLTMSVRLQKDELSATREELVLTRSELAASRSAQEEQARLALVATKIRTLNLKLLAVTNNLDHQRRVAAEVREHIREKGQYMENVLEPGEQLDLGQELDKRLKKITILGTQQDELIKQLDALALSPEIAKVI